ncbi:class I SAM-dependent methyltransferase [Megamonas funiformis]|uniref:class I SAM-dependent methyltransferase n=1 Tax=Megamonas funiformis TaxID=437897 RepID=UPI003F9E9DBF
MTKLLQEIQTYWTNRAEGYSQVNQGELHSEQKHKWQQTLLQYIPFKANKNIKILDIGTGPGFFAIILAQLGFDITAIDYTEQMLLEAKQNAGKLSEQIDFQQMDAQNLNFPDEKFDVIVTRNLTWNLENPQQAYSEWHRVLKKDGVLLNFDANWYNHLFDEQKRQAYEEDRKMVAKAHMDDHYTCTDIDAMENIARQVPLSSITRPDWDREILTKIGFVLLR